MKTQGELSQLPLCFLQSQPEIPAQAQQARQGVENAEAQASAVLCAVCVFRREKTHRVWEDPLLDYKIPDIFF